MRFRSFLKEIRKHGRMVEKRKKRKADDLSNPSSKPVRKKIRVKNQSQIQVPSSPPSSLYPSSPPSSLSPSPPSSSFPPSSSLSLSQFPSSLSPSTPPSSLSLPSSPSSSSHIWIHDVFPSFRGEDVRIDFLSHIQKEFQRKGITPFNDNGIKRGESIGPELIRAIRGSKIAIILLSRNYASSKWCLDELVEIMKCREKLDQTVMAVFYKVDPSEVKKLTGYFGEVFRKTCEGKTKEDIEKWRQALEKVATIAGYHSTNWDNEASMIEEIATDVSNKLVNSVPLSDFDGFVGMRAHMEKIEPFLLLGSNEVRMIGIWGPSGIGKSTIARFLFSKHAHEFQLSVFMENIKRSYPRPCYDEYSAKLKLQEDFLSKIINQDKIRIHHLGVAQDRLKDKRVLAVLDDVDHLLQLDAMAKETQWFGPGSRIIITTQDKKLLNAHRIKHIYEVDFPNFDDALEIFCMYAFGQKYPYDGFENLSLELTYLAGELPLGLRVMGSYFKGLSKKEWEEELPRLRIRLDGEIECILKFSYDALCDEDQSLFLHIACFFNGEWIGKVEEYLADNFVGVKSGLRVLAEKSLISITRSGSIRMHDLLVRLGREIIRKQSIHEPGQRQFLVGAGDIRQVLRNDSVGSRNVIGIDLEEKELKISGGAFENMTNVQFLRLNISDALVGSLKNLPPKLRLLHWSKFPMTCLPSNFQTEFLVEINMRDSNLEKLWEGNETIRNLRRMDFRGSRNLKELPDLSTATNLQELILGYCSSLISLPSSIGYMTNLEKMYLTGCSSLVKLPSSIGNMTNLERLDLTGCSSLVELPSSIGNMTKLMGLYLKECSSLVEFPSSIGNMTNLKKLDLTRCSSLVELPSSFGNMTNVEKLDLYECSSLQKLPSSIGNLTKLEKLDLFKCSSLKKLPSSIGNMNLLALYLNGCSSLVELPSSVGNLHNLQELQLKGCSKLKALPINVNMKSLDEVDLTDCSSLKSFPEISTNIRVLKLNGTAIEEIPPSIRSWSHLHILNMPYCENLYNSQHAFDCITELHLSDIKVQEIAPWVKEMSRLETLTIKGCTKLVSLPQLPDSLEILVAENCESLERLDCSFYKSKFTELNFVNCFKLNQEARDHIIKTSTIRFAVFPGEKVPTYFTFRTTGSSLSMKLNGFDTYFPTPLRFKACVLLVNKRDVEARDLSESQITYNFKDKLHYTHFSYSFSLSLKEHLFVFETEETVESTEVVFKFEVNSEKWEIKECGILTPESYLGSFMLM